LVHHGVDVAAFQPAARAPSAPRVPVVVSVGRLVEKKGHFDLLHACRSVRDRGVEFICRIYGDGPLRASLVSEAAALGLSDQVSFVGSCTQREIASALPCADLFALTPIVTDEGDRDGIPNVILEAMACGVPVVATCAGGIPEAVIDGETGMLAPPGAVPAIADAMTQLLTDADLRRRLGRAARESAVHDFDSNANARRLARVLTTAGGWS
jgi:glycosyltransferase involved in cell wall biosynthesis